MTIDTIFGLVPAGLPPLPVLLSLTGLGAAVVLMVFGAVSLIRRDRTAERMAGAAAVAPAGTEGHGPVPVVSSLHGDAAANNWRKLLKPLEKHLDFADEEGESGTRLKLMRAGYTHPSAARTYFAVRLLLAAALAVPVLLVTPLISRTVDPDTVALIALGAGAFGFYLPYRVVQSKMEKRQRAIADGFPDALDMMVVCAEAGLGLDASFNRVGQQMASSHPELASEFAILALALRAGNTREEALRRLAARTGVDEVVSFVTLIVQSERLGASVAQTLRVQSGDMRQRRMLRAEEKAHKLPVKMVVPLVTCILPAMLVAVLLPGLIQIARNILPALG